MTRPGAGAGAPRWERVGPTLRVRGISVSYGGVRALSDVSLEADGDEVVGVIGPNGAGKTTLFDAITGLTRPSGGTVTLEGNDVTAQSVWKRARRGLGRTFQNLRLFEEQTVFANVLAGFHRRRRQSALSYLLNRPPAVAEEAEARRRTMEELRFLGLVEHRDLPVKHLSYGHRRGVEIARALAASPRVLLLDEPAAGMNPSESQALIELIRKIRDRGITVLLVEHHMGVVMAVSHRIVVLNQGSVIARGSSAEVRSDEVVVEAYLGRKTGDARAR